MSTTTFPVTRGLQQGRTSSPFLFTVVKDPTLSEWRTVVEEHLQADTLGINIGPGKYMTCLCYVGDTLLLAQTSEAAAMLEVFAKALNSSGLEQDVPQTGEPIYPNDPRATATALCVNCEDEGVIPPATVDPEQRVCPYIREGSW